MRQIKKNESEAHVSTSCWELTGRTRKSVDTWTSPFMEARVRDIEKRGFVPNVVFFLREVRRHSQLRLSWEDEFVLDVLSELWRVNKRIQAVQATRNSHMLHNDWRRENMHRSNHVCRPGKQSQNRMIMCRSGRCPSEWWIGRRSLPWFGLSPTYCSAASPRPVS